MFNRKDKNILAFDIECVAFDFDNRYDEETKAYLLKYAVTDAEKENVITNLVFNPFTSFVVAIGTLDGKNNEGNVYLNTEGTAQDLPAHLKDNIKLECGDEKQVIENFWKLIGEKGYNAFITFNGREFDCPFLMLRSFILGIKPSFNLMAGSDFTFKDYHVDLLKELTFHRHSPYGARRKFSLDFYCKQLEIPSPKADGVSGDKVGELYRNKEYIQLAEYCIGDVIAEVELYKKWYSGLNL
jgi:hypothetical protein